MNSKTPKLMKNKANRFLSLASAATGALLLAGCSIAAIERANYNVSEVESFRSAGAPNDVMMLEVVDADNTFPDDFWTDALSNHGYPRLYFVTDPADADSNVTIKPESRLVVVVAPEQATMRGKLCTDPQSVGTRDPSSNVSVRFGFCVGDKIISETRGHFNNDKLAEQIDGNADIIVHQLFPRNMLKTGDRHCSPFLPSC